MDWFWYFLHRCNYNSLVFAILWNSQSHRKFPCGSLQEVGLHMTVYRSIGKRCTCYLLIQSYEPLGFSWGMLTNKQQQHCSAFMTHFALFVDFLPSLISFDWISWNLLCFSAKWNRSRCGPTQGTPRDHPHHHIVVKGMSFAWHTCLQLWSSICVSQHWFEAGTVVKLDITRCHR